MEKIFNRHNLFKTLMILCIFVSCSIYSYNVEQTLTKDNIKFSDIITNAALYHNLPPALIAAVIHAESNFNPKAKSYAGAKGLMQINPPTQRFLRLKNVYDPKQNIHAGAKYIKYLLKRFGGNLIYAIAAYNAGPGNVSKHKGIPPFKETRNYVRKVLSFYHFYRS